MGNIFSGIESAFGDAISSATPLSKIPDQKMIYNKTQTTSILMKRIIDFILQNADIKDTISLATDKGCGEWLILAKSEIANMLTEIDVEPSMGSDGILYLEKMSIINPKEDKTLTTAQQNKKELKSKYCTLIAFFSIRLFQVVGALALSVLDSEIPLSNYDQTTGKATAPKGYQTSRSVSGIFGYQRPSTTRKVRGLLGDVSSQLSKVFQRGGLGSISEIFEGFYLEETTRNSNIYYLRNLTSSRGASRPTTFTIEKATIPKTNTIIPDTYILKYTENEPFQFTINIVGNKINLLDFKYTNSNKNLVYIGNTRINPTIQGNAEIIDQGVAMNDTGAKLLDLADKIYEEPYLTTAKNEINGFVAQAGVAVGVNISYKFKLHTYDEYNKFIKHQTRQSGYSMPTLIISMKEGARNVKAVDLGEYIDKYVISEIKTQPNEYILVVLKKYNYIVVNSSNQAYNVKDPSITDSKTYIFISNKNYSEGRPTFFYEIEKIVANKKYGIRVEFTLKYEPHKEKNILDAEERLRKASIEDTTAKASVVAAPADLTEVAKAKNAATELSNATNDLNVAKQIYQSTSQSKYFDLYFTGDITISIKDLTGNGKIINKYIVEKNELTDIDTTTKRPNTIYTFAPDDQSDGEPRITNRKYTTTSTIPLLLEKILSELVKDKVDDDNIESEYITSKNGFNPPIRDTGLGKDHPLLYTELWKELSKKGTPIKSFCVSRALQLLNGEGLQRRLPDEIRPMVSFTKFPFVDNKSLPLPGQPITTATPIKALDTLFKKPEINHPNGTTVDFGSFYDTRRDDSLKKILESFGNVATTKLSEINELNVSISKTTYTKQEDLHVIEDLRSKAIILFQTQFDHTRKVNILLKKIFTFDNGISVNPTLLAKGVKGIEDIAAEARDLLVDYYSKCQTAYAEGVDILKKPNYRRGATRKNPSPAP